MKLNFHINYYQQIGKLQSLVKNLQLIYNYQKQISKTIKCGVFLGALFEIILGSLIKVTMPFAENVLFTLGLRAATARYAGIQKKHSWFRNGNACNIKRRAIRYYQDISIF